MSKTIWIPNKQSHSSNLVTSPNMDSNKVLKISSLLFKIVCLAACMYQVAVILQSYFGYFQATRVRFDFPSLLPTKDLSQCYRYTDLIDAGKVAKKYNFSKGWKYQKTELSNPTTREIHSAIKISDIFGFTPPTQDVVVSCIIPKSSKSVVPHHLNKSECYQHFKVKKYFMMKYICYLIHWEIPPILNFEVIGTAFYYNSMMYRITLNRTLFYDTFMLMSFIHGGDLPIYSRYFASTVRKLQSHNYSEDYRLSFSDLEIKFLGYPYSDMFCVKKPMHYTCLKECLNNHMMDRYKRVSPEFIYANPIDRNHLTDVHFRNQTFIEEYHDAQDKCSRQCKESTCFNWYTLTDTNWNLKWDLKDQQIIVRVGQPSGPFIKIEYYPQNEFYDVFIYVCSTLGSWLGLVLIRLDPFAYYRQLCQNIAKKKSRNPNRVTVRIRNQTNNHTVIHRFYDSRFYERSVLRAAYLVSLLFDLNRLSMERMSDSTSVRFYEQNSLSPLTLVKSVNNCIQNHVNQTLIYDPLIANANVRLARLAEMTYRE